MSPFFILLMQVAILAYALVGGVFLAFSDFIMRSLSLTGGLGGVEAMQVINREVFRWVFMTLFLGMGAQSARKLGVAGEAGRGVLSGIDYLTRRKLGVDTGIGKRVVVIGGGNTAIDAARSARRDGADVTLLYRRGRDEIPAEAHEVEDAAAEGLRFECPSAPGRILRNGAAVTGIEVQRMRLGDADEHGRRRPIPITDDVYTLEAGTVLVSVSQEPGWPGAITSTGPRLPSATGPTVPALPPRTGAQAAVHRSCGMRGSSDKARVAPGPT